MSLGNRVRGERTKRRRLNWLILLQHKNPDPSQPSTYPGQAAYKSFSLSRAKSSLFSSGITLSLVFIISLSVLLSPREAHAGIFSLFSDIFKKIATEEVYQKTVNSQNVALLQAALNYDPNPQKGGGDITIIGGSALLPDSGPLGTLVDVEDFSPSSDNISIYVVREGDSLSQIAHMFGVSANTIIWANNIARGDLISIGQTLVILPVSGVRYTVLKGDTLGSIAAKLKGDVDEIARFNDLANTAELAVGSVIVIPDGELGTAIREKYGVPSTVVYGTNGPSYEGYYERPLASGRKTQGLHGFNGVDIGAPFGTPVYAAAAGTVIVSRDSGWNGGYGQYTVVSHSNGTQTLYAHMGSIVAPEGVYVEQGQIIGYVGSTGRSTGPHLHFEVRGARNPF
ncbi:MAG: peptidoglycan DD-metalloendopeptidase family protein [Parcubacteria group bacterium]|nr:peptidoglycan DD-metalloendopeptidase family protein [Parcubacteria group bacterium]